MKSLLDTKVLTTINDYRLWRSSLSDDGSGRALVGLVPTMGALHRGHATLMEQARAQCQKLVVSIFVNPLQFGPNEDFDRYPRTLAQDLELCSKVGVDAVLHPTVAEFYCRPLAEVTKVIPPTDLVNKLDGVFRPGHFDGVATVVLKLLQVAQPTRAYFGEKDYQQLLVIKRMVADLNVATEIVGVPTVRETDGLALSSRNAYLSAEARELAPQLNEAISAVLRTSLREPVSLQDALENARSQLQRIPGLNLQYLEACDADSLELLQVAARPMVILVAAKLGSVRLIDNVIAR